MLIKNKIRFSFVLPLFFFTSTYSQNFYENPIIAAVLGIAAGAGTATAAWWYTYKTPPNADALLARINWTQEKITPLLLEFKGKKITGAYLAAHINAANEIDSEIREFVAQVDSIKKELVRPELFNNLSSEKKDLLDKAQAALNENIHFAKELSGLVNTMKPHLVVQHILENNYAHYPIPKADTSNPYPNMRRISALNNAIQDLSDALIKSKKASNNEYKELIQDIQKKAEDRMAKLNAESVRISSLKEYIDELDRREIERHNREMEAKTERKIRAKEREVQARMIDATAKKIQADLASAAYQKRLVDAESNEQLTNAKLQTAQYEKKELQKKFEQEKNVNEKMRASLLGYFKILEEKNEQAQAAFVELENELRTPSINPELVEERLSLIKKHTDKIKPSFCTPCAQDIIQGKFTYPCPHTAASAGQ